MILLFYFKGRRMGLISHFYKKAFLIRYDKDPAIPYYCVDDFPGMNVEKNTFTNSNGETIHYFFYYYNSPKSNIVALFCPGMGPGHSAYFSEINELCKAGYKVLTLDYSGCGESSGKTMFSVNAPTRDTIELLNLLQLKEEIVVIGHSLGGYTALNIGNLRSDITKIVVISGFLSIENEMLGIVKSKFAAKRVKKFEQKNDSEYGYLDNLEYLKTTNDKIMYMQSTDDKMVAYEYALGIVKELNRPNIECIVVENKGHNPLYTYEAYAYMNNTFYEYNKLIKEKTLDTIEKRIDFFADKSIAKMTDIDQELMGKILEFIKG